MKKYALTGLILSTALLMSGCTDEQGNDKRALSLLVKADQNFNQMDSYVETVYRTKTLQEKITQTDVSFRSIVTEKDGTYLSGKRDEVVISYPTSVINKGDLSFQVPTKIALREKDSKGNYTAKEYMSLYEQGDYLPFKDAPYKAKDVKLDKAAVKELVTLASNLTPEKAEAEGVGMHAYSGADFHIKAIPNNLQNLKKVKEMKIQDNTYIVLSADVKAMKDEMFTVYKEAKAEFWIDKETHLLVKEIYKSEAYDNKTKAGMTIYQYSDFDSASALKPQKDLNKLVKQYVELIDLDEEHTQNTKYDITGKPLKKEAKKDE